MFQLLRDARAGTQVDLPDPSDILPYLDLYTLVVLDLERVARQLSLLFTYHHFPSGQFRPATTSTARIFDPIAAAAKNHWAAIPSSSGYPEFNHQRYWRLPINTEMILVMLIERSISLAVECDASKSRTLEKGEPQHKKARTKERQAIKEELGSKFLLGERVEQASCQSLVPSQERPWVPFFCASTFSTLVNDKHQRAKSYFGGLPPSTRDPTAMEVGHLIEWGVRRKRARHHQRSSNRPGHLFMPSSSTGSTYLRCSNSDRRYRRQTLEITVCKGI